MSSVDIISKPPLTGIRQPKVNQRKRWAGLQVKGGSGNDNGFQSSGTLSVGSTYKDWPTDAVPLGLRKPSTINAQT